MRIAAFDLGANMSVAHNLYGSDDPRVSHQLFKGTRVQRAGATWLWLHELFDGFTRIGGLDAVVIERPFARGMDATRSLWGIAGLIEAAANVAGYPVFDYSPGEIKKWATGSGNAEKDAMILAAFTMGYQGENEHEADAFCLLRFAETQIAPAKPARPVGRPRVRPLKEKSQ